jgi:hypothetical protein
MQERDSSVRDNVSWVGALTLAMVGGVIAIALYAWTAGTPRASQTQAPTAAAKAANPTTPASGATAAKQPATPTGLAILACGLLLALAAALVGALIGLTFGIPKTVKVEAPPGGAAAVADGTKKRHNDYSSNSNFEEISDWLTKILVGAGLVQIGAIPGAIDGFASRIGESGILGPAGMIVGPSIVIAYSIAGFGMAYLWARIYMGRELEEAQHDDDEDKERPVNLTEEQANTTSVTASAGVTTKTE